MVSPAKEVVLDETYQKFHKHDFSEDTVFQRGWLKISDQLAKDDIKAEELLKSKLFYYNRLYGTELSLGGYRDWVRENGLSGDPGTTEVTDILKSCPLVDDLKKVSVQDTLHVGANEIDIVNPNKEISPTEEVVQGSLCVGNAFEKFENTGKCHVVKESTENESATNILNDVTEKRKSNSNQELQGQTKKLSNKDTIESETKLSFEEIFRLVQNGETIPGLEDLDIQPTNKPATKSVMTRIRKPWEVSNPDV